MALSAKIRFAAEKSHSNFCFIAAEFPCFNVYLLLGLYDTSFQRGRWSGVIYPGDTRKAGWGGGTALWHTVSSYEFAGTFLQEPSPSATT